jgi:hypothetical protein
MAELLNALHDYRDTMAVCHHSYHSFVTQLISEDQILIKEQCTNLNLLWFLWYKLDIWMMFSKESSLGHINELRTHCNHKCSSFSPLIFLFFLTWFLSTPSWHRFKNYFAIEIKVLYLQPFYFLLVVEWVDFNEIWYMKPPGNFFGQLWLSWNMKYVPLFFMLVSKLDKILYSKFL